MSDPAYIQYYVGLKHVRTCQTSFHMSTFQQFKSFPVE